MSSSILIGWDEHPRGRWEKLPAPNREASKLFGERLAGGRLELVGEACLEDAIHPDGRIFAASFPGVSLYCDTQLAIDEPSKLASLAALVPHRTILIHTMSDGADGFAFAMWSGGSLVRALSVSPDDGVVEDIGARLAFELPYWAGEHPVEPDDEDEDEDEYALPFHPLELGEEALVALAGLHWASEVADSIVLPRFRLLEA